MGKNTYNVANAANQALIQAQADLLKLTETFIKDFQNSNKIQTPDPPYPPICPQVDAVSTDPNLYSILKSIQDQQKELQRQISNKENIPRNQSTNIKNKPWKYCWTHGMTKSHDSKTWDPKYRIAGHKEEATYHNQMGGCKSGTFKKVVKEFYGVSWRGQDAVSSEFKLNFLHQNSQYPLEDVAYIDSAASDHFGSKTAPLHNIQPLSKTTPIYLTNGETIEPIHKGILPHLDALIFKNKTCQICPANTKASLISMGKLCDDGAIAIADEEKMIVYKDKPIMKGARCQQTGMYVTSISNPLFQPKI